MRVNSGENIFSIAVEAFVLLLKLYKLDLLPLLLVKAMAGLYFQIA